MNELFEQAKVNLDRGEFDQAIVNLTEHLNSNFHDPEALFMLGGVLLSKGKNGLAAAVTRQAIEIRTKLGKPFPEALMNLGTCFKAQNNSRAAEEIWQIALEQETIPKHQARLLVNLGACYINEGAPDKALAYYNRAIELDPSNLTAIYNRGLAHLEMGNWQDGWIGYDSGFQSGDRRTRTYRNIPEWDGSSGKNVIVWGEQGVGDEILFASCLPDLINVSNRVIFDCHPRLTELFTRSFPGIEIHGTRKTLSGVDWLENSGANASVCISSLPKFFRNADHEFPGSPYLIPEPFKPERNKLRVGISWCGGTAKTRSDLRTTPLALWEPILRSADAEFFSLQYTESAPREVCEFEERTGIRITHYPGRVQCKDYDRTASFVSSMDLVITVCTTVFHVAGAMGVPVWCLVPSKPAWRYGLAGEKSPWYGSARLIRQKPNETWEPVIQQAARDLADFS